jgi:hypothetical protein
MAKKTRSGSGGRGKSRRMVDVNPFVPAVPLKGRRLFRPILGVPLALIAGSSAAALLPARALTVDAEATRQQLSVKDYERTILARKADILRSFENESAFFVAQEGKGAGKGRRS